MEALFELIKGLIKDLDGIPDDEVNLVLLICHANFSVIAYTFIALYLFISKILILYYLIVR